MHHTVGVPLFQLPPPAFLQVAFAKVVLLISNIFDFQCETHRLRPPKRHKMWDVWSGAELFRGLGECGRGVTPPWGAQHALGGWECRAENMELTSSDAPGEQGELRMPSLAIRFHFPCHNMNCLPHSTRRKLKLYCKRSFRDFEEFNRKLVKVR